MINKLILTVLALAAGVPVVVVIVLSTGGLAPTLVFSALLIVLWAFLTPARAAGNPNTLALATGALAIASSWPGMPGYVLAAAAVLCVIWGRALGVSATVIGLISALGIYAALVQSYGGSTELEVMGAYSRSFVLASAILIPQFGTRRSLVQPSLRSHIALSYLFVGFAYFSIITGFPARSFSDARLSGYMADGGLREFGWATSPNEMGFILALVAVGAISGWARSSRSEAPHFILLLAGSAAGVMLTGTRSALIALLLAAFVTTWVVRTSSATSTRLMVMIRVAVVAGFLVAVTGTIGGRDLLGRAGDGSATYRSDVTRTMTERLLSGEQGLIGAGLTNGNQVRANALTAGIEVADGSIFYLAASVGLIGLAAVVAMVIAALWRGMIQRSAALPLLLAAVIVLIFENAVAWPSALIALLGLGGTLVSAVGLDRQQRAISGSDGIHKSAKNRPRGRQRRVGRDISRDHWVRSQTTSP